MKYEYEKRGPRLFTAQRIQQKEKKRKIAAYSTGIFVESPTAPSTMLIETTYMGNSPIYCPAAVLLIQKLTFPRALTPRSVRPHRE